MAFNRDLSQFAAYLNLDAAANYIGITSASSSTNVGIGLTNPSSKLSVAGDANISGNVTAAQFLTGSSGQAIGISTDTISGPATLTIDPAGVGDNTGVVVIKGDLQVDGTETIINSTTVTVNDKNIQIADGAINDAAADGAGITVNSGDGNKTFQFNDSNDSFQSNISLDVASGQVYKVNGTEVLSSDTLGSGVVNSSLTSVGTLGQLVVSGVTTSTGGFVGDLSGDVTGNADTATTLETARDFSASGDATASAVSFDGSGNVDLALTLANTTVSAGSYGSSTQIPTFTVDSKGRLTAAGTASVGTALTVSGDSGSEVIDLLSESLTIAGGTNLTSSAAADTVTVNLDENISLTSVSASGVITATSGFVGDVTGDVTGDLTGNVTGNVTGDVTGDLTGNVTGNVTGDVTGDLTGNVTGDLTGNVTGNVTGDVTGNADTATALETSRDFSASGDVTASAVSFDGTANVDLALTLANTTVSAGSYGSSTEIPTFTVDSKGRLTAAGTASVGTALTVSGDSGSEVIDLLSETLTIAGGTNLTSSAAADTITVNLDSDISLTSVTATGNVNAAQFLTGSSGQAIGINTNTISGPETLIIDPAAVGDNTGVVVIKGDLQVDGTETIINSTTVTVNDKNIQIADGAINDAAADGAGVTVNSGDGNKTFQFSNANYSFQANTALDVTSGNVYKIDGTEVLSSDTLGSGVVNSSLTSVGTLGQLEVSGVTTSTGGFVGDVTGDVTGDLTGDVTGNLTGNVTGNVTGDVTGDLTGNVTGNLTGNVTGDVTGDLTGNVTGNVTGDVTGDLTGDVTGNVTGNVTGDLTGNVTGDVTGDLTGNVTGDVTGNVTGDLTGNADTATALQTARDFSISGDATASAVSFDGTANVGLTLTLANTAVSAGSYGSSTEIPTFTVDSKGRLTAAGTASVGTALTVSGDSGSEVIDLLSETLTIAGGTNLTSSVAADTVTVNLDDNISLNSVSASSVTASGLIVANYGFIGDLTGNVTGDVTGDLTGNVTGDVTGDLTGNVTGNINSSGLSTVTNLEIGGYVSIGNTYGELNQVMASVGAGVTWKAIADILPQTRTTQTNSATAGQTAFSFDYNVNYLDVFVNGVKLDSAEFTATNGTDITLTEAAFAGDKVEFISYNTVGGGSGSVNSLNDLSDVSLASPSSGNLLSYNGSTWVNNSNLSVGVVTTSGAVEVGGNLTVTGDLTVEGSTTTINSTTLTVEDLNIVVANGAASAAAADGAGLTVDGANATFTYASTGDKFVSNKDVEAPNFNSTSDRNLKENIRPVEGASELVSNLEGVHFTWKSNGQETIGVIAQQIEEHLPQLVQTGETHKTVNYNGLIGVLIEAVKEQGSQIAALKAEIEELKK